MKKQKMKTLQLNKKSIADFKQRIQGGAFLTFDALCQGAPKPGPDSNHTCYFSCPGDDMPSCHYSECC
ncbi:MAG: hypothetical protein AAF611_10370 [Bacteroidota bacterium]